MTTFNLPDLGEGLTEATLLSWLVDEGDTIEVDQPVAEVETAKSTLEVPSPYAGTVTQLHGAEGETMVVERPLISVDTGDAAAGPDAAAEPSAAQAPAAQPAGALDHREEERAGAAVPGDPDAAPAPETAGEGSGNVLIGYGTSGASGGRRRRRRRAAPPSAPSTTPSTTPATASPRERAPRVSSPLVRRLARDHAIPLSGLAGSGPDGLILRSDVLAAMETAGDRPATTAQQTSAASPAAAQAPRSAPAGLEVSDREPITGIRKAVATRLATSRREIPEATTWQDVDVTELLALRARLKEQAARTGEEAPSLLALIGRFVLAGLARHPELATRVDDREDGEQEIVHFDGVNLGFAAQTDTGLVVPVVRRAERLSARGLHQEVSRLVADARAGRLSGAELSGGTFTVNNYGVFGSDGATPIINHPEVAILGIGRILERPWAVDGELAVRSIATLTLTFDHRVCDGSTAGGFLNFVAACVEDPTSALANL
ncbi:2-oxo acid dehydrogenase subunit E2 [Nesterenkonia halophila]|uniref:dihydrolipoamide acetyltransferase family protein n=1 Tax=Nesterenkonia halophila TaxID=302044 RepID=UPI0012917C87|nr:dihydrolipoamide acetyltransferase family protein [Nesterenkonia halophila]